ncbi:sensor histidine kinase [Nostoc ellipsosporum NOK]|nr:sensor histidine kinase [Nostoc ellipsosporum NOK]
MAIILIILSVCAGICLYVGLLHLLIGFQRLQPALHVWFGLSSLLACGYILALMVMCKATNIEDYILARKGVAFFGFIFASCLVWFVAIYTNFQPVRLILALNSIYLICILSNFFSPAGIAYSHISRLSNFSLPWGELITYPEGKTNPLIGFQLLGLTSATIFMFYACYYQYQRGEKQAALSLSISVAILIAIIQHDRLVDLQAIKSIYLAEFGFLSFVLVMSLYLAGELFQVVKLRQQLLESERLRKMAVEEERNRLARELHDSVSQTLFSVASIAEALPRVWQRHPETAKQGLEELAQMAQGALAEMRNLLIELRPSSLAGQSLGKLLQQLTQAIQDRAKIQISTTVVGDQPLSEEVKLVFCRVTQEALTNTIKHAKATQISVSLHSNLQQIALRIRDNGCGFNLKDIPSGHFGIQIMRERAELIGASFNLDSHPGKGTEILLIWDLVKPG